MRELGAALLDDLPADEDVHEVGLDVVEDPLVMRDHECAHVGADELLHAGGVKELVGPEMGALVITHYQRILDYITPDHVHVFVDGRIVESGGPELAKKLEAEGYVPYEEVTV